MDKRLLDKLIEFIKIDSYAFKKAEVINAQEFVKTYLSEVPISWSTYDSTHKDLAPILFGQSKTIDKSKPQVTLTGHLDIVYSDISDFKIKLTDDKLFGPGTADMKAGVLVILEAVKTMHKKGKFSNINLLFTSEEEHFKTKYYPAFEKLSLDIQNLLVYEGEGSLESKPNLNEKPIVTKRKGILGYTIKATGPGGHSGVLNKPELRHSTIHELIHQSQKIQDLTNYDLGTTVNIGKFNGGQALNILAPEAEISFDTRLDSKDEYFRIKDSIENIHPIDKQINLQIENLVNGFPVEETPNNLKLFNLADKVGKGLGIKMVKVHKGGASDMNRISSFNPNIACLDYLGPSGSGEHTKGEFLYLETFNPCVNISVKLIEKILNN